MDRTIALENEADDYNIACKIRAYVTALESKGELTEKELDWISWAKEKADWYDPTVNRVDRYFGVREHKKDSENKRPRKSYLYNWHN
ncbi:MAG: hypothetical protein J6N52_13835 [Clostridia bacterium]|nr:hypothetical protein [Clostridia bacterium]